MADFPSSVNMKARRDGDQVELLVDGHVDLPYHMRNHCRDRKLSTLAEGPFTLTKAKECGLRIFCTALYCEDRFNGEEALGHYLELVRFTEQRFDGVAMMRSAADFQMVKNDPALIGTLLLLENADALASNLGFVKALRRQGIYAVGLTHAGKNRLGDGNGVAYSEGLTPTGREVLRAIEREGLAVDLAHLHPRCFWELVTAFKGPIMTSHTGVREICDIQRNIDMEQAEEIFQRRGLVGISVNPEMLSTKGTAGSEEIFVHLDSLVQRFGPNGVGIGSDFCGFEVFPDDVKDVGDLLRIKERMIDHGYGEEAVQNIMGLNWLRFYESLF